MSADAVTVSMASIPPRQQNGMFLRAVSSVSRQEWPAHAISVAVDIDREGAPPTKQRALHGVRTPWVAFLDDDDEFLPSHLKELLQRAWETEADYVYSMYFIEVGPQRRIEDYVFPLNHWTDPWDDAHPKETTSTILCRTELAKEVGFYRLEDRQHNTGEDWRFVNEVVRLGGKIVNHPVKTWVWHHDSQNTSGLPTRW